MGMVVKLVGLPDLGKTVELQSCPQDMGRLVKALVREVGPERARLLIDQSGHLDPAIQVFVNHKPLAKTTMLEKHPLHQGDQVLLMLMAAGG